MKIIFLLIFLTCVSLLGYVQYLQHVENLLPCPLCVAQRVVYWSIGLIALLAFLHNPKTIGHRIYSFLIAICAVAGMVVAARQSWLIRFPESFSCGISPEEAFLNSLPFAQWWPDMFEANGDCMDVDWEFLSLTIPDWSLVAFISLGAMVIIPFLAKKSSNISNQPLG